jgi:hypothetical protein
MVRPSQIYIGAERGNASGPVFKPKIYLRTTLFSSGKRGQILESVYVTLKNPNASRTFSIWVFGDGGLSRGSAMFVGESGVASNHHFLEPSSSSREPWEPGTYELRVMANTVQSGSGLCLFECTLTLSSEDIAALHRRSYGVYFDWDPELCEYRKHVRSTIGERPEFEV